MRLTAGHSGSLSLTLRGVGIILPWTLALLTGTAQHSITFSNSSCVCASACLCSWKKIQALRVHPTSELGAELCPFPTRSDSRLVFLVTLSDYSGDLDVSQQKGHIVFCTEICQPVTSALICALVSYQQQWPLVALLAHEAPPGTQSPGFCPHNRLTQETALLDKSTFLNTPRIVKKFFFNFTGYTTLTNLYLKNLVSPFFSLNHYFSFLSITKYNHSFSTVNLC